MNEEELFRKGQRDLTPVENELQNWGYKLYNIEQGMVDGNGNITFVYVYKNDLSTISFEDISETIIIKGNSFLPVEIPILIIERTKELGWKQFNWNNKKGLFDRIDKEYLET